MNDSSNRHAQQDDQHYKREAVRKHGHQVGGLIPAPGNQPNGAPNGGPKQNPKSDGSFLPICLTPRPERKR
jgi:hypothetical protein